MFEMNGEFTRDIPDLTGDIESVFAHDTLFHRDLPDQHPLSAITGLVAKFTEVFDDLEDKVDKIAGKGLSTNDFTNAEKAKLANLENYDDTSVKNRLSTIEGKEDYWDGKANPDDIPTKTSDLTNDSNYVSDANYVHTDNNFTTDNKNSIIFFRGVIPEQATDENQLADKDFVNSSVATNTSYYIYKVVGGEKIPFDSLAELEAYSGTLTNNDYAFVKGTDSVGNTTYTRYKYNANEEEWAEEFVLNNSSFTAVQWAAINSGITSELVTKLTNGVYTKQEIDEKIDVLDAKIDDVEAAIPTKTSDITNDSGFITSSELTPYRTSAAQDVIDAGKANVGASYTKSESDAKYLTQHQDISSKQDKTDSDLATVSKSVVGAINEVNSLAKNANKSLSCADYETLVEIFNPLAKGTYNVGQNVYIKTTDVPDLWIYDIANTSVPYTYVSDEQFLLDLIETGTIQCGYYIFGVLETAKVDLSEYYKKNETYSKVEVNSKIEEVNATILTIETDLNTAKEDISQLESGKQDKATTGTFTLAVASWVNKEQTVNVTGVTASNNVFVNPQNASKDDWGKCGIWCKAQGSGTLTFSCEEVPTVAINGQVVIL